MKNQYFGDKRDLFKYDLWLHVAERVQEITSLTFIPMLTPYDPTNQGGQLPKGPGPYRQELYEFLKGCCNAGDRSIAKLRDFFRERTPAYRPYRETEYFKHESRDEYFRSIPSELLANAVILIDPDIGLERNAGLGEEGPERYVACMEIASVAERCSEGSVILLFQFLRGGKRRQCLNRLRDRESRLRRALSGVRPASLPIPCVAEGRLTPSGPLFGDVAFFMMGVGRCTADGINQVVRNYGSNDGLLHSLGEGVWSGALPN
jgi:hypothetical protein